MSQANCLLDTGISRVCMDNTPGLVEVFIANFQDETDMGYLTSADNTITGYTGTIQWFKFEFPKNTASFVENMNAVPENDEVSYEQIVSMVFNKRDAAKRNLALLLAKSTTLIIIKDKNGLYNLVAKGQGANLSTGNTGTGDAPGSRNGYSFEFTAIEKELAPFIDYAAFSGHISATQI